MTALFFFSAMLSAILMVSLSRRLKTWKCFLPMNDSAVLTLEENVKRKREPVRGPMIYRA